MKTSKALEAFSALAQETRLSIFRLLVEYGDEGLPAGKIAEMLEIQPATLSFHLAQLSTAKLVRSERHGRMIIYSVNPKTLKKLIKFLTEYKKPSKAKKKKNEDEPVSTNRLNVLADFGEKDEDNDL